MQNACELERGLDTKQYDAYTRRIVLRVPGMYICAGGRSAEEVHTVCVTCTRLVWNSSIQKEHASTLSIVSYLYLHMCRCCVGCWCWLSRGKLFLVQGLGFTALIDLFPPLVNNCFCCVFCIFTDESTASPRKYGLLPKSASCKQSDTPHVVESPS